VNLVANSPFIIIIIPSIFCAIDEEGAIGSHGKQKKDT